MLECAVCTAQKFHDLDATHMEELRAAGAVGLECPNCKRKTYWLYGAHGGVATPLAMSAGDRSLMSAASAASSMSAMGMSSTGRSSSSEGPKLNQQERRLTTDRRGIARRRARRVALQMPVRLRVSNMSARFEEVTRTINTCKTGIYIQTEQPYAKGAAAMVAMNYNPRETGIVMDQQATVVRVENMPGSKMRGVALQFN